MRWGHWDEGNWDEGSQDESTGMGVMKREGGGVK